MTGCSDSNRHRKKGKGGEEMGVGESHWFQRVESLVPTEAEKEGR